MSRVAVPVYMQEQNFSTASPGLRFGLYLNIWDKNWEKESSPKLTQVCTLCDGQKEMLKMICSRQRQLFDLVVTDLSIGFRIEATSNAPFMTGMGYEHPLENGFAFLDPYGLPYLPGSSIKGVLRSAAQELASGEWESTDSWSSEKIFSCNNKLFSMIDILLGYEETLDGAVSPLRGVLNFWDVYPEFAGDMRVEVMTPHQQHYYQNGVAPHDSGQPIPIPFLSVPVGSKFCFHIQCDTARLKELAPGLAENAQWQRLLESLIKHACKWWGFGAKTSVGYGHLIVDDGALLQRQQQASKQTAEAELRSKTPFERQLAEVKTMLDKDRQKEKKHSHYIREKLGSPLFAQLKQLIELAKNESTESNATESNATVRALFDEIMEYIEVDPKKNPKAKLMRKSLDT